MTRAQLQARVTEGAKDMLKDLKRQGQRLTYLECKKEMEKVLRDNYEIV